MTRLRTNIIIILLGASLFALLLIQYFWINNAIENSTEKFKTELREMVSGVITEVEKSNYCIDFYSDLKLKEAQRFQIFAYDDSLGTTDSIPLNFLNTFGEKDVLESYESISLNYPLELHVNVEVKFLLDEEMGTNKVVSDLNSFEDAFGQEIINVELLDSLLTKSFLINGISSPFDHVIVDHETGADVFSNDPSVISEVKSKGISLPIYADDRFYGQYDLYIHFPSERTLILSDLGFIISSSMTLFIVLTILFISFIRTMASQRRLAEMKIDLVNNMTHEFRTPLSNINLAIDALKDEVNEEGQEMLDIIRQENDRLQEGIDLVLSTALIDKKELTLNKEQSDIHLILKRVVQNIEMSVTSKGGSIELDLDAKDHILVFDELHVINVLNNLLDNAIKYNSGSPMIRISTAIENDFLKVLVEDNGIGISSQDLPHIFERFYRVSTKDRYEAQGFGIGLYYVSMIMVAHGGKVEASSSIGKGSTFTLFFPK